MRIHDYCLLCDQDEPVNEHSIHISPVDGEIDELHCDRCGACLYDNIGMTSSGHCCCGNCGAHVQHGPLGIFSPSNDQMCFSFP